MIEYITTALVVSLKQIALFLVGVFALSVLLHMVTQKLRACGSRLLGRRYYYVVAPGVACHETGHALGCILTRTKLYEFVPFRPQPNGTLGWITHARCEGNWFKKSKEFWIATGPVWFGCIVIFLISQLLSGQNFMTEIYNMAPTPEELNIFSYLLLLFVSSLSMIVYVFHPANWSLLFPIFLYLLLCVTSEIALSSVDIKGMKEGLIALCLLILVLNFIPGMIQLRTYTFTYLLPFVFILHTIQIFTLIVNISFIFIFKLLTFCIKR